MTSIDIIVIVIIITATITIMVIIACEKNSSVFGPARPGHQPPMPLRPISGRGMRCAACDGATAP